MSKTIFSRAKKFAATSVFATLLATGSASALTLTYDGSVTGFRQIDMTSPTMNNVNTGAFKMKDTTTFDSFTVFCLDLLAEIRNGESYGYKITEAPYSNSVDLTVVDAASGFSGIDRVQRIFDAGYDTALSNVVASAGFQMALWNAVYDVDWSVDANAGTFYQTDSDNEDVRTAANSFLTGAAGYTGTRKWNLTFLESTETDPRSQNLVTAAPSPVPLPAAGLMLLTALGGLLLGRRRTTM